MEYYKDDRIIYFIPPNHLVEDIKRLLDKYKIIIEDFKKENNEWKFFGKFKNNKIFIKISSQKKKIPMLKVFEDLTVNEISLRIEGEKNFINEFKNGFEISLLRCLG